MPLGFSHLKVPFLFAVGNHLRGQKRRQSQGKIRGRNRSVLTGQNKVQGPLKPDSTVRDNRHFAEVSSDNRHARSGSRRTYTQSSRIYS